MTSVVNFIVPALRLPLRRFQTTRRICNISTRASLNVTQARAVPEVSASDFAHARDMLAQVCSTAQVSSDAENSIVRLCEELMEYGTHTNLTGVKTLPGAIFLHGIDSLSLVPTLDELSSSTNMTIVDIGSGAGFPGFPVALAMDSMYTVGTKKVYYDVAMARAVAKLHILSEYALPLVKKGGFFIAQKSLEANHAELKEAERAIRVLGGEIVDVKKPVWTEDIIAQSDNKDEREKCLIIVEKIKDTPSFYPRSHSAIKRNPL